MKQDKNSITIECYDRDPVSHSRKFENIGIRKDDIDFAFKKLHVKHPFCLELGCGDGRDAEYIITQTPNYIGLDASRGLLDLANKRLPRVNFMSKDMRKVDFYEEQFDIIFAFAAFLHLNPDELTLVLSKTYIWLKKGGLLSVSLKYGDGEEEKNRPNGTRYFYFYNEKSFAECVKDNFLLIKFEKYELLGVLWFRAVFQKN
jgi:SAM-dependent methyltransferase